MSTDGPEKDASLSYDLLIKFLNSKLENAAAYEKTALKLIRNGGVNLSKADKNGYHPIHLAAMNGSIKVFKALCKKGISPYAVDENGFTPFHYAKIHKQTKLLEYYEKNYPFDDIPKQQDAQSNEIDEALQHCGLLAYSIDLKENVTPDNYLIGLFTPALPNTEQKRSKSSKPDFKKQFASQITPSKLSHIAFGITEELKPTDIIRLLTKQLPGMELNAKLACIFFIKELIRQDSANEWCRESEFRKLFREFIRNIGSNLAMTSLKGKLQDYFRRRQPLAYLKSIDAFTFDLNKLFSDDILKLSPKAFLATNLLKNAANNQVFLTLSEHTNQLSQRVCMDILRAESPEEGAKRFVYYMDVIDRCVAQKNYAAAFAIYNGLQFNVVQRLKEIKKHIPDANHKAMTSYDSIFHPSGKGLRSLMIEYSDCIPVVAFYSADKDKISENSQLSDRVALFGKLNQQFTLHREYLSSLAPVHAANYLTDLCEQLQRMTFSQVESYWYSYHLEPARVLILDDNININSMLADLKLCRDMRSPLVVKQANKEYRHALAKDQITTLLKVQNYNEAITAEILSLCDKVIQQFSDDMPASEKRKNRVPRRKFALDDANQIEQVTDELARLNVAASDAASQKPRANTQFELSQKQRRLSDAGDQRHRKAPISSRGNADEVLPSFASSSNTFTPLLAALSSSSSNPIEKPTKESDLQADRALPVKPN